MVGGVEAEGGPAAPAAAGIAGVAAWPRRGCCEKREGTRVGSETGAPRQCGRAGGVAAAVPDRRGRGGGGAAGGGGGGWLAAVGRTCGGIEHGVVAAPAPFGKDGRVRFCQGGGTGGCGGRSSVVSAPGATEGATGGGENWAGLEGHEPEAVERRAVQPLESPLRQPDSSPAATNAVAGGGQNCGRMWAGGTCKKYISGGYGCK